MLPYGQHDRRTQAKSNATTCKKGNFFLLLVVKNTADNYIKIKIIFGGYVANRAGEKPTAFGFVLGNKLHYFLLWCTCHAAHREAGFYQF